MILIRYTQDGLKRPVDLSGLFSGQTAFLVGGSPSLLEQPYKLLEQRGVLSMAMNNAARLIRPSLWICGDSPNCYEPRILLDATILKFAPVSWAESKADLFCDGRAFRSFPNTLFYLQKEGVAWDEFLGERAEAPWYSNTLLTSIHVLYMLGVRRIVLAGSDLMIRVAADYAHGQQLGSLEKKWNLDLYNHLVKELRMMKPLFDRAGLELIDSSKNSRIAQVYKRMELDEAVELALAGFPKAEVPASDLPHCSRYAPRHIKEAIAEWPGRQQSIGRTDTPTPENPELQAKTEKVNLQSVI